MITLITNQFLRNSAEDSHLLMSLTDSRRSSRKLKLRMQALKVNPKSQKRLRRRLRRLRRRLKNLLKQNEIVFVYVRNAFVFYPFSFCRETYSVQRNAKHPQNKITKWRVLCFTKMNNMLLLVVL